VPIIVIIVYCASRLLLVALRAAEFTLPRRLRRRGIYFFIVIHRITSIYMYMYRAPSTGTVYHRRFPRFGAGARIYMAFQDLSSFRNVSAAISRGKK